MFLQLRYIITLSLTLFSFVSMVNAMETPSVLGEALKQGRQVALFNVNDCGTDADSLQSFVESLLLGSEYRGQIKQYFVTDDEVDLTAATRLRDEGNAPEYYQDYLDDIAPAESAYRAQDTATILFPLADKLGVNINIIQGEIPDSPSGNPYFGNCGIGYKENDLAHIHKIHKETGSQAVIQEMRKEVAAGKSIYVLNGGSFRLLSDIQETASDLLPYLDVTVMAFRQPMNFPPFTNPDYKPRPSWNEGIDEKSARKFIEFAAQSARPQLKAFRIVDSNTVEYSMICNGEMFPTYEDYLKKLQPVVSEAAYQNLLAIDKRHENWSRFKTRFADSIIVFDAFGLVSIPRVQGQLIKSKEEVCIRPVLQGQGFSAYYPDSEGQHPFSCPRAQTLEDQDSRYAAQYERVEAFRTQLRNAHQKTWDLLEKSYRK